ncbi:hypothetical protein DFH06DRAFT_1130536 [Mycena polygramma]|nr:hypothetical protein DFH06DRAFT_1130536 [Mycena polygramma]
MSESDDDATAPACNPPCERPRTWRRRLSNDIIGEVVQAAGPAASARAPRPIVSMETKKTDGPFQCVLPSDRANFRTHVTKFFALPDEVHATAWQEACTRLRETPCGWDGCSAVLNSFQTLAWHLHACHFQEYTDLKDSSPMTLSRCLWGGCGESFENRTYCQHVVEKHVFGALCCEYQRQGPSELMAHHVHDKNTLRPSIHPYTPYKAMPIPSLPAKIQKIDRWELSCPVVSVDPSFTGNAIRLSAHIMSSEAPRRPYKESSPVTAELTEGMSDLKDVTKLVVQGKLLLWPRGSLDAQQQPVFHQIVALLKSYCLYLYTDQIVLAGGLM